MSALPNDRTVQTPNVEPLDAQGFWMLSPEERAKHAEEKPGKWDVRQSDVPEPCPHECINKIKNSLHATPNDKGAAEYLEIHLSRYRQKLDRKRETINIRNKKIERKNQKIKELNTKIQALEAEVMELKIILKMRNKHEAEK